MNPVNWFEIPVTDLDRARSFYETLLGVTLSDLPSPTPGRRLAAFPWEQGGIADTEGNRIGLHSMR